MDGPRIILVPLGDVRVLVVSQRLGHSATALTTDRHGHVLSGQQKAAADGFAAAVSGF